MMTSVSSDRCRGAREKPQMPTAHAAQSQKQVVQATAEQMRLAQVIFDKNDSDFEAKVKQLMEVTGKNQDECIVALHDCNGDVNRAINVLLEGDSDTTSWETVGGKKKNFGKESSENKENREKRMEREASRGRGNNNRKGRGGSRGREFKGEENGIDYSQGDKPLERGKRARGRGFGRGRGRGAGRFSAQSMGTFNPAEYSESMSTDGCGTKLVVWEAAQNGTDEDPEGVTKPHSISQELPSKSSYGLKGAWKNSVEEWTPEDWSEDLSETKVFTASSVPAENHVTPGQSIDLVALLQKPVPPAQAAEVNSFETSQQQGFSQALVFTNSQHNNQMAPGTGHSTSANTYSPQSLSSVLGSGFGELAPSKTVNISSAQILDKLKAPSLTPFPATSSAQQSSACPPATTTSWDRTPSAPQASVLNHFDFKSQPEPSPVLSQLSQRQQQTQAVSVPSPGVESFPSRAKHGESAPIDGPSAVNRLLQLPNMAVENIVSAHQPQPKHIKLPKRRIPPASKNGHGGGRSQHTVDTTSSAPAPNTTDPPALPPVGTLPCPTSCAAPLPPSAQHTATSPSSPQAGDLSSSPLSQLSSSLSSHQNSLSSAQAARPPGTPHTHAAVESTPSSANFSPAATSAPSVPSSGATLPGNVSTVSSLCLGGTTGSVPSSSTRATALVTSGKAPPNLPQGVPPLLHNQYLVGPGGLLPAYPIYGYDELQMLQSRLPMDYYGIPFAAPTALASRDGGLPNNPYSGDVTKFGRGDSASPAPPTTPAQAQQNQSQTHHTAQQPFLNPALPPGYSYPGLPYYTGVPSAFQYGPTMFVPPTSAKQHGVTLGTPPTPFQQASGYGQHTYSTGYDELTQGTAAGDYTKGGYGGSSQTPNKTAGCGPGKGVSVSSGTTGLPDMTGSVYKTQTFDKQSFHAGTPPPFSLPSALGSTGPLAPGAAPGYAPAPFLHIMPAHQQPHSQLLHHHLPQDAPSGSGQRSQPSSLQPKSQASKATYSNSPYWTN
nr:ubiquitin-associated protein 2 isoform X5 [Meriones unguiculatus]